MSRKKNHKKRNTLRHAWRLSQGKSNKLFTPFIEVQPEDTKQKGEPKNDDTKQKETYAV